MTGRENGYIRGREVHVSVSKTYLSYSLCYCIYLTENSWKKTYGSREKEAKPAILSRELISLLLKGHDLHVLVQTLKLWRLHLRRLIIRTNSQQQQLIINFSVILEDPKENKREEENEGDIWSQ